MYTSEQTAVQDFRAAVAAIVSEPAMVYRRTARDAVLREFNNRCLYCEAPADGIGAFVPARLGGTKVRENIVALCRSCRTARGEWDPVEFAEAIAKPLRPDHLRRRLLVLDAALQHDIPAKHTRTFAATRAFLVARFSCARVPVAVGFAYDDRAVLIAPLQQRISPCGGALLVGLRAFKADHVGEACVCLPTRRLSEAAPWMIERNALLRALPAAGERIQGNASWGAWPWREGAAGVKRQR